jgi:hypothetical protein
VTRHKVLYVKAVDDRTDLKPPQRGRTHIPQGTWVATSRRERVVMASGRRAPFGPVRSRAQMPLM